MTEQMQKIADEMVDAGFTGVELRLHDDTGDRSWRAGLSEVDGNAEPPPNGHVRIGSNTKTFVAVAVLRLVADGLVELDGAVDDHLPGFGLDRRITVRMLLQHTSGLFNHTGEYYEDGTVAPGILWQGKEFVESRFQVHRPEDLVRFALSKPVRFEPGADWSYANTNYVVARLLLERVTGRPIDEVMRKLVLGPLGLADTSVPTGRAIAEPHAHAYYRYVDAGEEKTVDVTGIDPSWISSGGDMISTTADLGTFIRAVVRGELLPAPLLAEMLQPHSKVPYGLGVFVQETGSGRVISHNGGAIGHGALMYATADGCKTLTAALNYVDDADLSLAEAFQAVTKNLVGEVFG
ncbi:serine hydrolase domain-containing protein [Lentzea sp. DG1S-22]|uniref:serine hydrolase domain-containing protein n=1 Tax=Lentzea sp. DG1S-22 TaxID=3108822 RepID=UPI002E7A0F9D|nr:serine hydrolase domain-containing protein [Lentzea sp. DG1S-22]WVH78496.1 serine hydrolase domain-containing protein [Lentzea sp. DG1S-22]